MFNLININEQKATFQLCTDTIIATVPTSTINIFIEYINRGIIVSLDTIIDITVLNGIVRITIGDKWFACDATTNLPNNVSVSVKLTISEFLDKLREGWLIV